MLSSISLSASNIVAIILIGVWIRELEHNFIAYTVDLGQSMIGAHTVKI